jgi:hypothetical protein
MRTQWVLFIVALVFALGAAPLEDAAPPCGQPPQIAGCDIFPEDNVWNIPIDQLPVSARSTDYVNSIGVSAHVHADFGSGLWNGGPIGIPYCVVPGNQPLVNVSFYYSGESDPGPYPVPTNAPIEGNPAVAGDHHVLVVDSGHCKLYELYDALPQADGSWHAGSGAVFDLNSNALRPDTWTSADAAGLPILPGLVRYEEVASGEIRHALRFTAPVTQRAYVWPARHYASYNTDPALPPMGQRFRLRANVDISIYSAEVQVILRAMKKYGIILADNGSAWYISGVPNASWNNDALHLMGNLHGSDFEAVDCSSLMIDANSARANCQAATPEIALVPGWNLIALPCPAGERTPAEALTGLAGHYDLAEAYDAATPAAPWRLYGPTMPAYANDLTHVNERMGLWLRATSAITLPLVAASPGSTTIALYAGWNLVGYPSLRRRSVTQAFASIAGQYTQVYAYDAADSASPWQLYDPQFALAGQTLTELVPGRGYWIKALRRCDWVVANP